MTLYCILMLYGTTVVVLVLGWLNDDYTIVSIGYIFEIPAVNLFCENSIKLLEIEYGIIPCYSLQLSSKNFNNQLIFAEQ